MAQQQDAEKGEAGDEGELELGTGSDAEWEDQVMLILVGLPGSSKSTFSTALVEAARRADWSAMPSPDALGPHSTEAPAVGTPAGLGSASPPRRLRRRPWARVSQDEAPSRRRQECESAARTALARGDNVVIDRVNFDPPQRAHFIDIARDAARPRPPRVYGLVLDVSLPTLERRLAARPCHPTLPDLPTAQRVLRQMLHAWRPPRRDLPEGFDRVYTLRERDQPAAGEWGVEALDAVLRDIAQRGEVELGERGEPGARAWEAKVGADGSARGRGAWAVRGRGGYAPPHAHRPPRPIAHPHAHRPYPRPAHVPLDASDRHLPPRPPYFHAGTHAPVYPPYPPTQGQYQPRERLPRPPPPPAAPRRDQYEQQGYRPFGGARAGGYAHSNRPVPPPYRPERPYQPYTPPAP